MASIAAPPITVHVTCLHCGDRCGADACRTDSGVFCCAGCEAVYSLLADRGLTRFYICDVRPGASQRGADRRDPARFAVLDDPAVAARFVTSLANGTARVVFSVPGIHCGSCVWLLEKLWKFEAGIGRSEVDLLARTVRVDFEPERTSVRTVAERLASLGYEPLLDGERARAGVPTERRALYLKIGVAGFAFGNVMLFSIPRYLNGAPLDPTFQRLFDVLNLAFTLPVLLYSASDYLRGAWRALIGRQVTLDIPITIGLIVLFGRSVVDIATSRSPGFLDSFAGLVFFLLIGRLFQQKAFDRIAFDRSIRSFLPLAAYVEREGGATLTPIDRLVPGDVLRLRPHEIVPADAVLIDSRASLNNAFVTGEQDTVSLVAGERVQAGSQVVGRAARFRVEQGVSHTRLAHLWAHPVFDRPKVARLEQWSSSFGAWFTVTALGLAVAGAAAWWPDARMSAEVATAVLIIACPCAFTLAAPIAVGTAMGVMGRAGLYLKHAAVASNLSRIDTVVLDKTGTLTTVQATASGGNRDAALVRALAAHSVHPASRAVVGETVEEAVVEHVCEAPGGGISGTVDGHRVVLGSARYVSRVLDREIADDAGATWFSVDGTEPQPVSVFARTRPGIDTAVRSLSRRFETWLVSGDHARDGVASWRPLFGDRVRFQQSPEDKLAFVTSLGARGRRTLMVGDGLNDAGALAAASVGIAVSDDTACLVPACDAVIDGRRIAVLPALIAYARRLPHVIALCFAVSVVYNVVGIGLALAGSLTPLASAVLMPVSSITIVALSTGLMRLRVPMVRP
jgi:Cu+-exporting ATPase